MRNCRWSDEEDKLLTSCPFLGGLRQMNGRYRCQVVSLGASLTKSWINAVERQEQVLGFPVIPSGQIIAVKDASANPPVLPAQVGQIPSL